VTSTTRPASRAGVYDEEVRGFVVLVLVAACYDPSVQSGAPCSANGTCPSTLECTGGYCVPPGTVADAHDDGAQTDDVMIVLDSMIDAPPSMGWSQPIALVGVNSTSKDSDPTFTNDRLELYFVSTRAGGVGNEDIWYTKRTSVTAAWAAPINVTAVNSTGDDSCVEVSADGMQIWFASTRSGSGDIYTATQTGLAWGTPTPVTELNTTGIESGIGVSPDGLIAIIDRGTLSARTLHIASRANTAAAFSTPVPFDSINSMSNTPSSPSLTNNADAIYFHADSTRNIYVVKKMGLTWSAPQLVTDVSTPTRDAAPFVTQSDNYMMFEHDNQLYETSR